MTKNPLCLPNNPSSHLAPATSSPLRSPASPISSFSILLCSPSSLLPPHHFSLSSAQEQQQQQQEEQGQEQNEPEEQPQQPEQPEQQQQQKQE